MIFIWDYRTLGKNCRKTSEKFKVKNRTLVKTGTQVQRQKRQHADPQAALRHIRRRECCGLGCVSTAGKAIVELAVRRFAIGRGRLQTGIYGNLRHYLFWSCADGAGYRDRGTASGDAFAGD